MLQYRSKLRLYSKGGLNNNNATNSNSHLRIKQVGRKVIGIIPILSIFALLGIISSAIINPYKLVSLTNIANLVSSVDGNVYADEVIGDKSTASITIAGSGRNSQVSAARESTAYRSHTITLNSDNVRSYNLVISGDSTLNYKGSGATNNDNLTSANGATGSAMSNNTWGYAWEELKDSTSTGTTDSNLTYTAPTTSGINLVTNKTINGTLNSYNKLVFAAKFDQDKPTGTYQANVTLSLIVTPRTLTTYAVTYNCNSGTNCPSNYNESSYDESKTYTIPSTSTTLPTRSGYDFLGYNTDNSTNADTNYAPGKTITLTATSSNPNPTVTLYAVWKVSFNEFPSTLTTMQGMTADICKNASIGATKTLTDSRDQNTYTIQKLTDGNCWMTQNLRLNPATNKPTSADSDIPAGTASVTYTNASSSWTDNNVTVQFRISADSTNATNYGGYYSWCAATAGTCKNSSGTAISRGDAASSICSKGWKLPMGGTTVAKNTAASQTGNDFANLAGKTTTDDFSLYSSGNTFTLGGVSWYKAGRVYSSGLYSVGSNAYYWSRTANSSTYAYRLYYYGSNSDLRPADYNNRHLGLSVRCVAYSS